MLRRNILLAAPLFALLLALPALGQANDAPAKVAVCNASKVFRDCLYFTDLNNKIKATQNDLNDQISKKRAALQQMQDELKTYKSDSAEYAKKSHDLLDAGIEYDVFTKESDLDLQRQQKLGTKQLYEKVEAAIAEVAQKEGISLVIADQHIDTPSDAEMEKIDPNQLNAIFFSRTVLYMTGAVDITEKVKVAIDFAYNKENPNP